MTYPFSGTIPYDVPNREDHPAIPMVAAHLGIPVAELMGSGKKAEIVKARDILCYILRNKYTLTYQEIASVLQRGDHSIAMYGCSRCRDWMRDYQYIKEQVEYLMTA